MSKLQPKSRRLIPLAATTGAVVMGAAVGFAWVRTLAATIGSVVYLPVAWDAWFDADPVRSFEDITQRTSLLFRSALHPLFGILARAPYLALTALFPVSGVSAVQLELALVGAGVLVAFGALVRTLEVRWLDTVLLTALVAASAPFVFFAAIPETFVFGAFTTLVALVIVLRAGDRPRSDLSRGAALTLACAATATNVMTPLAALMVLRRPASWLRSALVGLALLGVFTVAESRMFPLANSWVKQVAEGMVAGRERRDAVVSGDLIPKHDLAQLGTVVRSFFAHSTVLPPPIVGRQAPVALTLAPSPLPTFWVQGAAISSHSALGMAALAAWITLASLAVVTWIRGPRRRGDAILALAVTFQLALHLVIGRETFLYALHFQPLLVAWVGSAATRGRARPWALALTFAAATLGGTSNFGAFGHVTDALAKAAEGRVDLATPVPATTRSPFEVLEASSSISLPDLPLDLEIACEGPSCSPKVGAPIRALEHAPGAWSVLIRVKESGRRGVFLRMAERGRMNGDEDVRAWYAAEGAQLVVLRHRWVVTIYPKPESIAVRNATPESCGGLEAPCWETELPEGKAWRIAIADALSRPAWQGMGPISDPRVWPTLHVHRRRSGGADGEEKRSSGGSDAEDQVREPGDSGRAEEDRAVDGAVGVGALPLQATPRPHAERAGVQ